MQKRTVYENREEQKSVSDPLVMIYGFYRSGPSGKLKNKMICDSCRCNDDFKERALRASPKGTTRQASQGYSDKSTPTKPQQSTTMTSRCPPYDLLETPRGPRKHQRDFKTDHRMSQDKLLRGILIAVHREGPKITPNNLRSVRV